MDPLDKEAFDAAHKTLDDLVKTSQGRQVLDTVGAVVVSAAKVIFVAAGKTAIDGLAMFAADLLETEIQKLTGSRS